MKILLAFILTISLALSGCAGMTPTQQRTLSGGALGAGSGAVIGAIAGNAGMGCHRRAAGLAGGYLWDSINRPRSEPISKAISKASNRARK